MQPNHEVFIRSICVETGSRSQRSAGHLIKSDYRLPDLLNLLSGAAAHGQQLSGRNRLATLVVTITTHIGVTGLASYHRYRRIEHVHWITSKHWTGSPPIATVLAAER